MENTRRRRRRVRNPKREEAEEVGSELIGNLPREIVLNILTRLPLKSLCYSRWVSKTWYNTITHAQFALTHHLYSLQNNTSPCVLLCNRSNFALIDHQPFDEHQVCVDAVDLYLDEFKRVFPKSRIDILGSMNGLVCFYTRRDTIPTSFYVCNPITEEHVILPKSPDCGRNHDIVGFGFDSGCNEYKVIRIFSRVFMGWSVNAYRAEAEIYTLGSGMWRRIENVPHVHVHNVSGATEAGVFVNGSLHWFTRGSEEMQSVVILSFILTIEEFGVIKAPPAVTSDPGFKHLTVMENQLCIATRTVEKEINIWVMKEYGVDESWSRLHVFKEHVMRHVHVGPSEMVKVKKGEFLLWGFNPDQNSGIIQASPHPKFNRKGPLQCLQYYDFQTKMVAPIKIENDPIFHEPYFFHGSLLSPKCIERSIYRMRLD